MDSLYDLFVLTDEFTTYLEQKGFDFDEKGFPIFKKEMFLTEIPELLVPVQQRKNRRVVEKKKTVIVFFCGDIHIYRRLPKLISEIDEYKEYMGVAGFDVTLTCDMEPEWQLAIMLLNLLSLAVLASNGIKIVLNTRTGGSETKDVLNAMPKGIIVASGFLGGSSKYITIDYEYIAKIMRLMPQKVLIYGSCNKKMCKKLDIVGIDYIVFKDFRKLCKEVA